MSSRTTRRAAERIIRALHHAGHVALLAGGCVRDLLLGREPADYDVVTDARPERVVRLFKRTERVGAKFGVVLVRMGSHAIEVATFRSDGGYGDGRHPDSVSFGDAVADALRRDFTINGMFYDIVQDRVIDHVGGLRDLEARVVRAIGDADARFAEDHLRMLRAVRFTARLDFVLDPESGDAIRRHAHRLPTISEERIRDELKRILTDRSRARGWRLIVETGLHDHLLKGVRWSAEQAAMVADRLAGLGDAPGFALALASLLCAMRPDEAESACRKSKYTNRESRAVAWLLTHLPRVRSPERLELADIKLLMADPRFADLCALLRADLTARSQPLTPYATLVERSSAIPPDAAAPSPFVTGDDLLARNVPQGPAYARILESIYRAQLNGRLIDRAAALAMLDDLLAGDAGE